ncbi:thiosulfate oxidation carrier protein SoxY [Paramagnetospirillum kuznetsovii]|nr:thiosulfate oxidation carrier protein SoxY [Paramagnetospirillum kuznetsovii]
MSTQAALSRRRILAAGAAGATAIALAPFASARADSMETDELARQLMGRFTAKEGKVRLKIKETAESGANEPVGVVVDSPMTPADHVKAIHILAEGNPYPVVASWYLTPRSGRAEVNFRMRLAKTQVVRAYAVTSDGTVWMDKQEVKVTLGGCGG